MSEQGKTRCAGTSTPTSRYARGSVEGFRELVTGDRGPGDCRRGRVLPSPLGESSPDRGPSCAVALLIALLDGKWYLWGNSAI
jgi:hypothetical protein